MYQRGSNSGGSGGAQVVTGDVTIVKGSSNEVNVGFTPDIIFFYTYGGNSSHSSCYYVKDATQNPGEYFIRAFYNPTLGTQNSAGAIKFGNTPAYPNYAYLTGLTANGFTFTEASNGVDTQAHCMAIKLS